MSAKKKVSKKKVLKIVLISLAVFIVLNLLGAAIGTSTSITHPKRVSYEDVITEMKDANVYGNFDSYDKEDYIVSGLDGYELHCAKISTPETVGTGKYLIYSHGHKSNMYAASKYCDAFIDLGFTCIIYDLRDHGANEKAICSMGGYEAQDLNYLIEDTVERYGDVEILGLHGESMGASTTLNALRYTDKYLYPFGTCADLGFKLIYGIDDAQVSGIDALKGSNVPVLFIHGLADDWIDVENSEDMYEVASQYAYSEIWLVEGAGHARSREVAGSDEYRNHIESFLRNAGVLNTEVACPEGAIDESAITQAEAA